MTAVPLHPARRRERGFNQAELLGRQVAATLGVPYVEALSRIRSTGHQAQRQAHERLNALQDAFGTLLVVPPRVLLIDDVTTTGSTLLACAAALREGGAEEIYFAAVAR